MAATHVAGQVVEILRPALGTVIAMPRVVELEASHSPFLSVPDQVVEVIDAVA